MNNTSTKSSEPAPKPALSPEVRSGILVCLSLVVMFALIFVAGNVQIFSNVYTVPVVFHYISGLEKNAPVHYAGHRVGKVTGITFIGSEGEDKVLVTLSISKDVRLHADSQVFIDIMGFMGEKFIEVSSGTKDAGPLPQDKALEGTDPVPMMKVVKDGTELLTEFRKTADTMKVLTGDLKDIVGGNKENLNQIFENLNATTKNLKDMTEDLKLHPWKLIRKSEPAKKKRLLIF